jgi:3-isopropylmalate/(R)-2-methylmalate dehydratase small subunit
VDTDLIIPAQYLTSTKRGGYGENLFRRLKDDMPDLFLNQPRYQGASILMVGPNFGCGSSREHAVWALLEAGIKVVIGSDFADIFASNSAKNSLLLISLRPETVSELLSKVGMSPTSATVDLASQEVIIGDGGPLSFSYDPFRKECLLQGYDDVDYLMARERLIREYFTRRTV